MIGDVETDVVLVALLEIDDAHSVPPVRPHDVATQHVVVDKPYWPREPEVHICLKVGF